VGGVPGSEMPLVVPGGGCLGSVSHTAPILDDIGPCGYAARGRRTGPNSLRSNVTPRGTACFTISGDVRPQRLAACEHHIGSAGGPMLAGSRRRPRGITSSGVASVPGSAALPSSCGPSPVSETGDRASDQEWSYRHASAVTPGVVRWLGGVPVK
jgi:hypothetical protein